MLNQKNSLLDSLGFATTPRSRLADSVMARGVLVMPNGLTIVAIASFDEYPEWSVRLFSGYDCRLSDSPDSEDDLPSLVEEIKLKAEGMRGPRDDATGNFEYFP
jgi:hypothetical protein